MMIDMCIYNKILSSIKYYFVQWNGKLDGIDNKTTYYRYATGV